MALPTGYKHWSQQRKSRYWAQRRSQRAKAKKPALGPLYDPSAPLAGTNLKKAVGGIVNAEFAPKEAALGRQAASAQAQGTALIGRAADYSNQVAGRDAEAAARMQALDAAISGKLADIGKTAQSNIDQAVKEQQDAQAQDAAVRGPGLGGTSNAADELARERATAAADAQAQQASGAASSKDWEGLINALSQSRAIKGQETQRTLSTGLANTLNDIAQQRATLEAGRGDEAVKQLTALRQSGFDNAATLAGLGLKREDLQLQAQNQRAQIGLAGARLGETSRHNKALERAARSRARQQASKIAAGDKQARAKFIAQYGITPEQSLAGRTPTRGLAGKGGRGAGGKKESQSAITVKRGVQNALTLLNQGHSIRYLAKQGAAPDVLQAAQDLKQFGHLMPDSEQALRRLGVRIPKSWRFPKSPVYQGPH